MDDPLEYESYRQLCRVCMETENCNEETKAGSKILLKKYLSVDIEEEEGFFPKKLCKKCTAVLVDYHSLCQTVEKTTVVLNSRLGPNNAFEIEEQEIDADLLRSNEGSVSVEPIIKNEYPMEDGLLPVNVKVTEVDIKEDSLISSLEPTKNVEENYLFSSDTAYCERNNTKLQKNSALECRHPCPQCEKKCKSKENLESHMRLHQDLKNFQCSSWNKTFTRLKKHLAKGHGERKDIVCNCGQIFRYKRSYERHMQAKHSLKNTNPPQDGKDVTEQRDIGSTSTESSGEEDTLFSPTSGKIHKGKHKCSLCSRRFQKEETLDNHMRTHRGLKPFQCPHCELAYYSRGALNLHITEKHTVQPVYECEYAGCGKKFSRKKSLGNHIRKVHRIKTVDSTEPKIKNFICEECGSAFITMHGLNRHRFTHLPKEDRPFECKECGKRYLIEQALNEHLLRHAGIKNFECPYCGLKKTTKHELKVHINCHTKEKQWQCQLCSSVFNSSANLKRHDRVVHRAIRAFKCQYCELSFGKKETLTHHERRHTGEKPYECKICDRRFIQLVNLKAHLNSHSKHEDKIIDYENDEKDVL